MASDATPPTEIKSKLSKQQLFKMFLKTGRKRITLSILCGTLIFLAVTGLVMIIYTYRFNIFQSYNNNYSWNSDGKISVGSNYIRTGQYRVPEHLMDNFTTEFIEKVEEYVPNILFDNITSAISAEIYIFDPFTGGEPWINHEIMAIDDVAYEVLNESLIQGRMPQNSSELVVLNHNPEYNYTVNQTIPFYPLTDYHTDTVNLTVVGILDNIESTFLNAGLSSDIFDWEFSNLPGFYNYFKYNTFLTNFTMFTQMMNDMAYYSGLITHLVDIDYDCSALKLNNLNSIINGLPKINALAVSTLLGDFIELCPDLKNAFIDFGQLWAVKTTSILSINAPLLFIIGLLSVVTLNIGSSELESIFRRMKLYGLSYRTVRGLVFFENFLFTTVSLIGGSLLGYGVSYLTTGNVVNKPFNYYINFLQEPLLLIALGLFYVGFFLLSFLIQNGIARRTTRTTSEEYRIRRTKLRNIFSTNEFRLFVPTLILSIISLVLYLVYNNAQQAAAESGANLADISYLTYIWFMIMCSITFLMTFCFLLIARLITFLWGLLSNNLWKNRLNLYTLSLKHLSIGMKNYQIAMLGALIFGLVILPGAAMDTSISSHLNGEIQMLSAGSNLVVPDWSDSDGTLDEILANVTEIEGFTEVAVYSVTNDNDDLRYPKAFSIGMLSIENVSKFIDIGDMSVLQGTKISIDDLSELENDYSILMNKKFARKNHLKYGANFTTSSFSRYDDNLTFIDSFTYFPMTPIPKKPLFSTKMDVFSIVGNEETIRGVVRGMDLSTEVRVRNIKLIQPVNESVIPYVKTQLEANNITALDYDELFEQYYSEVDQFTNNNLLLFSILAAVTLLFVSYFTGLKIYQERVRIIESFYRVGAVRRQIIGIFTFEYFLVNALPMLIALLVSLPLLRPIALYFLDITELYYPYKPGVAFWLVITVILSGLAISTIGFLLAVIPKVYQYKPVKQE
jgi:hypothetical protein